MTFKDRYLTENLSTKHQNLVIGSLGGMLAGKAINGAMEDHPFEYDRYAGLAGAATGIGAAALYNLLAQKYKKGK